MITRRDWLTSAALVGGAALAGRRLSAQTQDPHAGHAQGGHSHHPAPPAESHHGAAGSGPSIVRPVVAPPSRAEVRRMRADLGYTPVTTPDGITARWRRNVAWKEFHLVAHEVDQTFAPGMTVKAWGYNGGTPGPTIEAVEGDSVRIFVTNHLPEHTTVHWHGLFLPNGMDGVGGLLQPHIRPGETYVYEFELRQHGTFMYHPHADEMVQMALGMAGFFIVHPKRPRKEPIDRDFCILPHMWAIHPGTYRPDPMVMLDFDLFTFNGRAFPGTSPLVVRQDDRVRLRFANVSMTSHPIHIHGHRFWVTETDGGQIPESAWIPETSLDIVAGQTRAVDFVADAPGDWPLHCHKTHHAMNAMGHDLPNPIGADLEAVGRKISGLVPGFVEMGTTGMAEHAEHAGHMQLPENTLPMMAGQGPFGSIEMGGMFTVVKVRDGIESYGDPGWFDHPDGTVARRVEDAPTDLALW
ncbi:MAG: copper oxidase [Acidobacteriota bacterium]|nr:copper oxidase [Acidobacteriota bacterium]